MNGSGQNGFTLLEVMVALTIVGVAFAGLITAVMQSTGNATLSRERMLSHWVASNVLTEMQVMQAWESGEREGQADMGGHTWHWEAHIQGTPNPRLRRVDVSVFLNVDDRYPVSTLMGLLGHPDSSRDIPLPPPAGGGG